MALAASPPQSMLTSIHEDMSDSLDEEIAQVRAEIQALTERRKFLTSSLLSSTRVQARLDHGSKSGSTNTLLNDDLNLLLESTKQHSQSNIHRLGIGVTAFPFDDPSPEIQSKNPLLGIRIDVCNRAGRFDSPYYLFCIRGGAEEGIVNQELRIHRHTIPAFVPLDDYEKQYLPLSDEGYGGSEDSMMSADGAERKQDLHTLVARVRHDLVSWRLRQDAIDSVRDQLEIPASKTQSGSSDQPTDRDNANEDGALEDESLSDVEEPVGKFGVCEVSTVSVDARHARIVWADDRVGRIKISDEGMIEKAVVFGQDARIGAVERLLTEDNAAVSNLVERLETINRKTLGEGKGTTSVGSQQLLPCDELFHSMR